MPTIELCPETGICTIMLKEGGKVDLMPTEVSDLRNAEGDIAKVREAIAEADAGFAASLDEETLRRIGSQIG